MKKWFTLAALALVVFEVLRVYFIMPMPGSQQGDTLALAYALHRARWVLRAVLVVVLAAGVGQAWRGSRVLTVLALTFVAGVAYLFNAVMSAETMFVQPTTLTMERAETNSVDLDRIVVGVARGEDARAYPIQYIGYHHQVRDVLDGVPIQVTYCTVCRTGVVFEPVVSGAVQEFRLVGMDHFNAMFEDGATGSWWRQANGEAIAGPMTGATLPRVPSTQGTLRHWLSLHPASLVMQPDPAFAEAYASLDGYEEGRRGGALTRTAPEAWSDKAWVVGVEAGGASTAYDWNALRSKGVIFDVIGAKPIVLVLASDEKSFHAFERPSAATAFAREGDTLVSGEVRYTLDGVASDGASPPLVPLQASQEYWHSWREFHPGSGRY